MTRAIVALVAMAALALAASPAAAQRAPARPAWLPTLAHAGDRTAADCASAPRTMRDPCDRFAGVALQQVFGLADFADVGGAPLTTAAVADSLAAGVWPRWRRLAVIDRAMDDAALRSALQAVAAHTGSGAPVVALHRAKGQRTQFALLLPGGRTTPSATLRGAPAPRATCVIRGQRKAVVDALLTYCFGRDQRPVELYSRER